MNNNRRNDKIMNAITSATKCIICCVEKQFLVVHSNLVCKSTGILLIGGIWTKNWYLWLNVHESYQRLVETLVFWLISRKKSLVHLITLEKYILIKNKRSNYKVKLEILLMFVNTDSVVYSTNFEYRFVNTRQKLNIFTVFNGKTIDYSMYGLLNEL